MKLTPNQARAFAVIIYHDVHAYAVGHADEYALWRKRNRYGVTAEMKGE